MAERLFPPPWFVELLRAARSLRAGAHVYFDDPRAAAKLLTRDEARRIAANVAKRYYAERDLAASDVPGRANTRMNLIAVTAKRAKTSH